MLSPDPFHRPVDMSHVHMRLESIAPPQAKPDSNSNFGQISVVILLFLLLILFTAASITELWLGFLFLVNVGISLSIYKKWTQNIPYIGRLAARAGGAIVIYAWILFILLWAALGFLHFFQNAHF